MGLKRVRFNVCKHSLLRESLYMEVTVACINQIFYIMAWLMKKLRTVVTKLRTRKENDRPEVSLRKELDETKARLKKSEETLESLLKRVEKLEKTLVSDTALDTQLVPSDQPGHFGDDPVSFDQPPEQENFERSEGPVACHEGNRWKFWKSKTASKTLVYENYSSSRGMFSNRLTGVQGQFASMSYTTETMIENGAIDDAVQSQMHSEILRQAIEMTMRN